jgi:hypothetical protein
MVSCAALVEQPVLSRQADVAGYVCQPGEVFLRKAAQERLRTDE